MAMVRLAKSVHVSVAHRYWNAQWNQERNHEVYGSSLGEQGSNLRLQVEAVVPLDSDEHALDSALHELKAMVDHQSLMADSPSTLENIALGLSQRLFTLSLPVGHWDALSVWESENLWCKVSTVQQDVELSFRISNLTLTLLGPVDEKSGLAADRDAVFAAVNRVGKGIANAKGSPLQDWNVDLFHQLHTEVKALRSFRVDLGRHEYVLVHSES